MCVGAGLFAVDFIVQRIRNDSSPIFLSQNKGTHLGMLRTHDLEAQNGARRLGAAKKKHAAPVHARRTCTMCFLFLRSNSKREKSGF